MDTDISLELNNEITKKIKNKLKRCGVPSGCDQNETTTSPNMNTTITDTFSDSSDSESSGEKHSLTTSVGEIREDIFKLLTIVHSMELQIQSLELRMAELQNTSLQNTETEHKKIHSLKNELFCDFENFKTSYTQDFNNLKNNLTQSVRSRK
jgi:hypothetical protein